MDDDLQYKVRFSNDIFLEVPGSVLTKFHLKQSYLELIFSAVFNPLTKVAAMSIVEMRSYSLLNDHMIILG